VLVGRLLGLDEERRRQVIQEALRGDGGTGGEREALRAWMGRLADAFPGDAGVLAPLFLNLVTLEPGEALAVAPGEMHAYLGGTGLEVMANSDNVIRGGLTPKTVDRDELLRVARFQPGPVRPIQPERVEPGRSVYPSDAAEFRLERIRPAPGREVEGPGKRCVEIHLCLQGEGSFLQGSRNEALRFYRGDALLVPARAPAYRVQGDAVLYRVTVPGCNRA
jgi:mannose-6-phosphate isomerase